MRLKIIGLMSGTSLDGIDAVLLEVQETGDPETGDPGEDPFPEIRWRVHAFRSHPFSSLQRDRILGALSRGGARELARLHTDLGEWFSEAVLSLLREAGEESRAISAVGSHGQTLWHDPPTPGRRGRSFQLGCPSTLAERTGIAVVSDFRSRDVAAGGHGAPLVPWADALFFRPERGPRVIQNLGGMANVTWLPGPGDPASILAFDTGPGVALLNTAATLATGAAKTYDVDGALARRGRVVEEVLQRLLAHPFFQEAPPRSTGRETFSPAMVEEAASWMREETGAALEPGSAEEGWPDLLATLTALTARSVGEAYRRWVMPLGVEEVFLAGGGARNPALREALARELDPIPLRPGHELGMDPDAREAAAFALLAWAHIKGIPANVPQATGALGPRILGSFTPGGSP